MGIAYKLREVDTPYSVEHKILITAYAIQWTKWLKKLSVFKIITYAIC